GAAGRGRRQEAEDLARRGLVLAADDPDQWTARSHAVFCFSHLCELAWQRSDWNGLEDSARVGEDLARATGHLLELAEFLTWQAVLARRAGGTDRAARLFRQGERRGPPARGPPRPPQLRPAGRPPAPAGRPRRGSDR